MDVVGCFVIVEDKLLLVKRADHKSHSGLWAIPSGKLENNETKESALLREVKEETGIKLKTANFIHLFKTDKLNYYSYISKLGTIPEIDLNDELSDFKWVELKNIEKINGLFPGLIQILKETNLI